MIGKIVRGERVSGLVWYLFGTGRANSHVQPRVVAGWDGAERMDPAMTARGKRDFRRLIEGLETPLAGAPAPRSCVWHCSLRAAPEDPELSDEQWAEVTQEVLDRTGLAKRGDAGGCRWVAIRHAPDHVHLVVTLARQDGKRASVSFDRTKVGEACNAVERRYGLRVTAPRDRTAARRPTQAEQEKARRKGHREPARDRLRREVQCAAAGASGDAEFFDRLKASGVMVRPRLSEQDGQVTGYAVAWPGGADDPALRPAGQEDKLVWFSGGKLAPDLTLPKLRAHWAPTPAAGAATRPRGEAPAATTRLRLRHLVERAAGAGSEASFFAALDGAGVVVKRRFSEHNPGEVTGYAVAFDGQRDAAGEPVWHAGGKLAPALSLPRLRQRWETGEAAPAAVPDAEERASTYEEAARAARDAAERLRAGASEADAEDVARSAADLLASVARTAEGGRAGPLHAAAVAYDRASRPPYRRSAGGSSGVDLRLAAAGVALLLRAGPSEAAHLGALVVALGGLLEAVGELRAAQGRSAQAAAARRAVEQLSSNVGIVGVATGSPRFIPPTAAPRPDRGR